MSKQTRKNLYQAQRDAIDSLPIHDTKAVEDVQVYLTLPVETLNKLPQFTPEGDPAFYEVGSILMGKTTLLKFIETIKNR